jgi:hypothetical protein
VHSVALCFEIPKTNRAFDLVLLHDGGDEKMELDFFLVNFSVHSLIHQAYRAHTSYKDLIPPRYRSCHNRLATLMVSSFKLFRVQ